MPVLASRELVPVITEPEPYQWVDGLIYSVFDMARCSDFDTDAVYSDSIASAVQNNI